MKQYLQFLKETWGLFLALFIAPLAVVLIFAIGEYALHVIDLKAGEWAALFGAIFGYWGTVILGSLAFWQNQKSNKTNTDLLELQRQSNLIEIKQKACPLGITAAKIYPTGKYVADEDGDDGADHFSVSDPKCHYVWFLNHVNTTDNNKKMYLVCLEIENLSDNIITQIDIEQFKLYDIETNISEVPEEIERIQNYEYKNEQENKLLIQFDAREKKTIWIRFYFNYYNLLEESFHLNFNVISTSIFNITFKVNVDLYRNSIININDTVFMKIGNCQFNLMEESKDE